MIKISDLKIEIETNFSKAIEEINSSIKENFFRNYIIGEELSYDYLEFFSYNHTIFNSMKKFGERSVLDEVIINWVENGFSVDLRDNKLYFSVDKDIINGKRNIDNSKITSHTPLLAFNVIKAMEWGRKNLNQKIIELENTIDNSIKNNITVYDSTKVEVNLHYENEALQGIIKKYNDEGYIIRIHYGNNSLQYEKDLKIDNVIVDYLTVMMPLDEIYLDHRIFGVNFDFKNSLLEFKKIKAKDIDDKLAYELFLKTKYIIASHIQAISKDKEFEDINDKRLFGNYKIFYDVCCSYCMEFESLEMDFIDYLLSIVNSAYVNSFTVSLVKSCQSFCAFEALKDSSENIRTNLPALGFGLLFENKIGSYSY